MFCCLALKASVLKLVNQGDHIVLYDSKMLYFLMNSHVIIQWFISTKRNTQCLIVPRLDVQQLVLFRWIISLTPSVKNLKFLAIQTSAQRQGHLPKERETERETERKKDYSTYLPWCSWLANIKNRQGMEYWYKTDRQACKYDKDRHTLNLLNKNVFCKEPISQ